MSVTAHEVASTIHKKVVATQTEIEKKYHAKLKLDVLDKLADELDHQHVAIQKESSIIQEYMNQAIHKLDDIEKKLNPEWDKRGIHHSLIPLHDYFMAVSHYIERERREHAEQLLKIKAQHEKAQEKLKHHAEYVAAHPEATAAHKPTVMAAPKLKDAHAQKIMAVYPTLNLSPHAAWITGGAAKHNEQLDDELIAKLDHARNGIGELTTPHEQSELAHYHNHKVDAALSHYQQVLTKCQKGTGDDKAKVKHYTDCVHKLGQAKVNLGKVASHK